MYITALFLLAAAVNGGDDLLLLLWLYADGIERLPCAAVRADERFVVEPRKSWMFPEGLPTPGADRYSDDVIFLHDAPPHI